MLESLAEGIEIFLSKFGFSESVFRTLALAGKVIFAPEAIAGKGISFIDAELKLFRALVKDSQIGFENISQLVFRVNKVVA